MNFGFNSNVRVADSLYHVQTEDRGPSHPFIDTVVYQAGRVVHKVSNKYDAPIDSGTDSELLAQQLHERLAQQHRSVINDLETGVLKFQLPEPAAATAAVPEALHLRVLNPRSWLMGEKATLELEIDSGIPGTPILGAAVEGFLESDKTRSALGSTRSDDRSRATLTFLLPATVADGTALVLRATDGSLYGELRFKLKARRPQAVPASPSNDVSH